MIEKSVKKNTGKIIIHADAEIEDLIPEFLENQAREAERIEQLLELGDYDRIKRIGHSMRGAGGGYGFDQITDIGMSIETAAGKNDTVEIRKQVDKLFDFLDRVEVIYDP